jgi:hypothetical protein
MSLDAAPKRRAVLEFCKAEIRAGRPFPTQSQVAAHMGWKNPKSAGEVLSILASYDGKLRRSWDVMTRKNEYRLAADA